ncbi:NAD-dependent epimerase/dehydratase family protein [Halobacillus litoralis]|uniref:NAD-dependent epimerase/dehydratase family protein n=1 Tax=Halobacillus litoralis TaxID=45668 RepID=UPI001CD6F4F6|nr:NAD-dependent epimerase/dehydratase family protein [Halobacillus litoralis]MCA0969332.1 NAD-dependent epimerase/dehydratase family protein [Halobacillus litoralis]
MNLLIIGGSHFLGLHLVEAAHKNGHNVTLFNRGKTTPPFDQGVELIRGDREIQEDLNQLKARKWDAVIDTCGYTPETVQKSVDTLKDHTDHYLFVSTVSVYRDLLDQEGLTEEAVTLKLSEDEMEDVASGTNERVTGYYGHLKFHCEEEVEYVMEGRHAIVRPGLIVGPHDSTDRFTYWPERIAKGGEVLAPEPKDKSVQFIDVRDLAEWMIHLAENNIVGTFHAAGPGESLTMERFLDTCRETLNRDAEIKWADTEWLAERVQPWVEMPLWIGKGKGFGVDLSKAVQSGLCYRPVEETILDTYEWSRKRQTSERRAGLEAVKEQDLLKQLKS